MKKIKIIFSILLTTFIVWVGILSYLYLQVNRQLKILQDTRPMIAKIYHENYDNQSNIMAWSAVGYDQLQKLIINAIHNTNPSVVNIVITKNIKYLLQDPFDFRGWSKIVNKKTKIWGWSWIIISKDWLIITNKHVVEDINANYSVVMNDWTVYQANQVRFDPLIDIAVLQIVDQNWNKPTNLIPAKFQTFDIPVQIWQFVLAIWNVLAEYQNSATFGIISALNRKLETEENNLYIWLYQTDTPINPGNSWWPLIDIKWKVLWINTAINTAWEWIWFALPVNQEFIDSTVLSIKQYNSIKRPFLWIEYIDIDKKIQKENNLTVSRWALVQKVIPWSAADKAWLEAWDIIVAINWKIITKQLPFLYNIYRFMPYEEVELQVLRNWNLYKVPVKLWILN